MKSKIEKKNGTEVSKLFLIKKEAVHKIKKIPREQEHICKPQMENGDCIPILREKQTTQLKMGYRSKQRILD